MISDADGLLQLTREGCRCKGLLLDRRSLSSDQRTPI